MLVALAGLHGSNPKRQKREKNGDEFEKKKIPPLVSNLGSRSSLLFFKKISFVAPNNTTRENASEEEEEKEKEKWCDTF